MKPILFNTEMVKAILEGRKTVIRRVVKPQPKQPIPLGFVVSSTDSKNEGCFGWGKDKCGGIIDYAKPPYRIGDILYVRETWVKADDGYFYRANATPISEEVRKDFGYKWKPSIHMPKIAARIFLKVTNVRVERLQNMENKALGKYDPWVWVIELENLDNYKISYGLAKNE